MGIYPEMIKYSIIVPFYNTQEYVKNILCWFAEQSAARTDLQLILVDDGSTNINYTFSYNVNLNIKLFAKTNGGVSSARNCGMNLADGEYILFLDSDDSFANDIFIKLDNIVTEGNNDIVIFSFDKVYNDKVVEVKNRAKHASGRYILSDFFTKKIRTHICSMVFSNRFVKKHDIRFTEGINYSEDVSFIVRAINVAKSIQVSNQVLFYYNFRDFSAMNRPFSYNSLQHLVSLKEIKHLDTIGLENEKSIFLATCYINLLRNIINNGVECKKVLDLFFDSFELLNLRHSFLSLRIFKGSVLFTALLSVLYKINGKFFKEIVYAKVDSK